MGNGISQEVEYDRTLIFLLFKKIWLAGIWASPTCFSCAPGMLRLRLTLLLTRAKPDTLEPNSSTVTSVKDQREGSLTSYRSRATLTQPSRVTSEAESCMEIMQSVIIFMQLSTSSLQETLCLVELEWPDLSYTRMLKLLLAKLSSLGFNPKLFGVHSLRSGGATAATNVGFPGFLCAIIVGGWSLLRMVMLRILFPLVVSIQETRAVTGRILGRPLRLYCHFLMMVVACTAGLIAYCESYSVQCT